MDESQRKTLRPSTSVDGRCPGGMLAWSIAFGLAWATVLGSYVASFVLGLLTILQILSPLIRDKDKDVRNYHLPWIVDYVLGCSMILLLCVNQRLALAGLVGLATVVDLFITDRPDEARSNCCGKACDNPVEPIDERD